MDTEDALSEEINVDGDVSCPVTDFSEAADVSRAQDCELYQSLSSTDDLEQLLAVTDTHLTELSSINAALALVRAARMVEAERKLTGRKETSLAKNQRLLNLIRRVENIVLIETHRRQGICVLDQDESEDSASQASNEDQGLHMAWTIAAICRGLGLLGGLLGYRNDDLLANLASLAKPLLAQLTPHQLQNCLWAFASLGMKEPGPFFGAAVETIEPRMHDFSHESLVAILTSFAMVKVFSANLFDQAAEVLAKFCDDLRPQDISNCTWAFAILQHRHAEVFAGLGSSAARRINAFKPEQVTLLVWAFAVMRWRCEELFQAVQDVVAEKHQDFAPDCLANVLHAFALVGHRGSHVILEASAECILQRLKEYSNKALAKLVFAMSKTRSYVNERFFTEMAEEILRRMDGIPTHLLTAMLVTFSKVPFDQTAFIQRAAEKAWRRISA
ncbi:unnamed protein product [Effrenium voratum]|nr:unnamed protein product [Effrenium voratum]